MMRRKDREKDSIFALEVLKNCEYATLATVNPDETPYCIPISPAMIDGQLYFHCALQGKKLDNILLHPSVCVSAVSHTKLVPEEFSTEFESAVALGECQLVSDEQEKIAALRAICEKYAASNMDAFEHAIAKSLSRTGVCKITITELTGKAKRFQASTL